MHRVGFKGFENGGFVVAITYQQDVVYVLCIPGWRDSQGIAMEVKWADDMGVPVFYASPLGGGYIYSEDQPND